MSTVVRKPKLVIVKTRLWDCGHGHRHKTAQKASDCIAMMSKAAERRRTREQKLAPPAGFVTAVQAVDILRAADIICSGMSLSETIAAGLLQSRQRYAKGRLWVALDSLQKLILSARATGAESLAEMLGRKRPVECVNCGFYYAPLRDGTPRSHACVSRREVPT